MNSKILNKRKALAIATALTLVFSSSVMAFASSTQTETRAQNQCSTSNQMAKVSMTDEQRSSIEQARSESVTEAVTQLVKAGTITQEEADKVSANMVKSEKPSERGMFASLTEDQRQALEKERQTVSSEALASLVSAGTITQDQADQFTTARGTATKEKTETRTTLTEAQKTAIREAQENCMTKAAANLVADGTITQSVADQLGTFAASKEKQTGSQNDVLTTDQRTALQAAVKTIFESKLAALVTAGTITQEQSNMFALMDGHNGIGNGGFGGHGRSDANATQTNSNETE